MSLYKEFRKFISRGNAIDLAVGVIIGASFGKIVTSLVNDVLMPPIGVFLGGVDFSSLSFTLKSGYLNQPPVEVKYGVFLNTVIDFMIVAACIFALLKVINSLKGEDPPGTKECPECLSQIPVKAKRCSHCTIELEHQIEPHS